jgi:hypothetical protein
MESEGKKISPGENMYITFLKDGTFIDSEEEDNSSNNKWSYDHKKMVLTTGDVSKKILRITEKELKLSGKMDGQNTVMTLKRVD